MGRSQEILNWIGNGFLLWAAVVATASVMLHLRVFDRSSRMSMHLLTYMAVMALVLDLSVIRILFGDSWWFQLLRLVTFIGVPVVMTQRLWLQYRAQRGGADTRDRPAD